MRGEMIFLRLSSRPEAGCFCPPEWRDLRFAGGGIQCGQQILRLRSDAARPHFAQDDKREWGCRVQVGNQERGVSRWVSLKRPRSRKARDPGHPNYFLLIPAHFSSKPSVAA